MKWDAGEKKPKTKHHPAILKEIKPTYLLLTVDVQL